MSDTLTALDGNPIDLDVLVNVKVKGEKAMRKGVTLTDAGDGERVKVLTGQRGRPATLPVESIERVRAL